MSSDFFRVVRGFEIDADDGTALIQIITSSSAPDVQVDAQTAPLGTLWIVNGGGTTATRVYQKYRDAFNSKRDWRDITQTVTWRDAVEVRQNIATVLPTGTPANPVTVDGQSITDGQRVLFSNLTPTAATATITSSVAHVGTDEAIAGAHANLYFTLATNGSAPIEYSIATAGSTDFDTIASSIQTAWGLGTVVWDGVNNWFLFTTTLTGSSASVEIVRPTASTPDLFVQIETDETLVFTTDTPMLGVGPDVYIYDEPTGTFYLDPAQSATDGDAVLVNRGTDADKGFFYNGTTWVEFGTGSASEEGFIRAFIGKDAAGPETPDYTNPTGGGPYTVGNIIGATDNLELAVAKTNAYQYQNTAELRGTNVVTISDTLPVGVNMAHWLVRLNGNADPTRVRAREIFAVRDNANNVDFTSFQLLSVGGNITNQAFAVTSAGGALTLTVTATLAFDYEIKRLAAMGPTSIT